MSDNYDKVIEDLKKDGFMKKSDFDGLLDATKELTIQKVVDHKDCGDSNCAICSMKSNIDGSAYERGAKTGISVGQKYPNFKFEV